MAALDTPQDFVAIARNQLQDLIPPYRYSDSTLVGYLNDAILEIPRLRPDLVFKTMRSPNTFPFYSMSRPTEVVEIDYRYRVAVLFYIVGMAQIADQEDTTDAHAAALMQAFTAKLMTLQA